MTCSIHAARYIQEFNSCFTQHNNAKMFLSLTVIGWLPDFLMYPQRHSCKGNQFLAVDGGRKREGGGSVERDREREGFRQKRRCSNIY